MSAIKKKEKKNKQWYIVPDKFLYHQQVLVNVIMIVNDPKESSLIHL